MSVNRTPWGRLMVEAGLTFSCTTSVGWMNTYWGVGRTDTGYAYACYVVNAISQLYQPTCHHRRTGKGSVSFRNAADI